MNFKSEIRTPNRSPCQEQACCAFARAGNRRTSPVAWAVGMGCVVLSLLMPAARSQPLPAGRLLEVNQSPKPVASQSLAIVGAQLIDGRGGPPIEDAVVLVRDSLIVAAGPRGKVMLPEGAQVFDATGLTLLPGLIDSHLHALHRPEIAALFLGNGVTSARDPGYAIEGYERSIHSERSVPRLFLTGKHLDQEPPAYPQNAHIINDAAAAKSAVHRFVDQGGTAIKIYFRLPVDLIRATCEAADARGVPVTGHLELVDARAAIEAGLDGLEHVSSVGTAVAEPAMAAAFHDAVNANNSARLEWRYKLWESVDLGSPRVRKMIDLIVERNVVLSPTLTYFYRNGPGAKAPTELNRRAFANMQRFVGLCHEAGASVVVGSHLMLNVEPGGHAFQKEMELLVESGMSPAKVIVAATMEGARFLRAEQRIGSIEPGKLADMILVDGDPLRDIRVMRNVRRVMLNGCWIADEKATKR